MPTSQSKPPARPQAKSTPSASAKHHNEAAECCDNAAEQHRHAAKSWSTGDQKKAALHAKNANDHCLKAQDHAKQVTVA